MQDSLGAANGPRCGLEGVLHPKRCRIASGLLLGPKRAQAERSLTGRPVKRKLASGPKPNYRRGRAFVLQSLAADLHRERLAAYDELVAGRDVYTYVGNDPLSKTDPTGKIIDTILDVAFIVSDVAEIASSGATATNVAALGADIVGALIPGATGLGAGVRGGIAMVRKGKEGVEVAKAALQSKGLAKAGEEITTRTERGATKFDMVMKDGDKNVGVEVKNGPTAKMNANQVSEHGKINAGESNTMVGGKAEAANLRGESVDYAMTVHVDNGDIKQMYCTLKPGGGC